MIYLDHNATTPVRPEVRAAMLPYLDQAFGNASSPHAAGRQARHGVEQARGQVAALLGCAPESVCFTSGGTEADNWALRGVAARRPGRIVTSAVEHPAVLETARALIAAGRQVLFLPVDDAGRVDPEAVVAAVEAAPTALVSLILANNETGVLQPAGQIGAALRQRQVPFHLDAVQACGRLPVAVDALHVDLMSLSAHKINGPKGVGALYVRPGTPLAPWQHGGGHEHGRRAGTENTAGIVGFGAAAALCAAELEPSASRTSALRDRLQAGILAAVPDVVVHGGQAPRVSNTLNLSCRRVEAEAVLVGLDLEGIAVSSGSACTSASPEPSHVLLAMGLAPRLAAGALRFSLGWGNDEADVDRVLEVLPPLVARLRSLSAV